MTAQLRSELYKLRTTRTVAGLLAALVGLVALAVVLHGLALPAANLSGRGDQRGIFIDVGINLGAAFAALLGALSITAEIRNGTIRPTLLVTPRRGRVIAAKAISVLIAGYLIGALATATAVGAGGIALAGRGLSLHLTSGDYVQLIAGGGGATALLCGSGTGARRCAG